jgi:hypothetical protein
MTKPHKHAALIKAWADGAVIEAQDPIAETWYTDSCPRWAERGQYRLKPEQKWQKERNAFLRRERIQWRSTCKQHAGMEWLDLKEVDVRSLAHVDIIFNEPTNEFRIPHKWQVEMDAHTRGEVIQYRDSDQAIDMIHGCRQWRDFDAKTDPRPRWITHATREHRIKPKTVKTRVRVAAMGLNDGCGAVWPWMISEDSFQASTEANAHFIRWLGDWQEIERPALDMTPPPVPQHLGGGAWFGIDPAAADSDITALLFVYGQPGQANPTKVDG